MACVLKSPRASDTCIVSPEVSEILATKLGPQRVKEQFLYKPGINEFKLHGNPWRAHGVDTTKAREIILMLLGLLEEEGWTVYASISQGNSGENSTKTDTVSGVNYASGTLQAC